MPEAGTPKPEWTSPEVAPPNVASADVVTGSVADASRSTYVSRRFSVPWGCWPVIIINEPIGSGWKLLRFSYLPDGHPRYLGSHKTCECSVMRWPKELRCFYM